MPGRLQEVEKAVDIRSLKALASERLPRESILQRVLSSEPDNLPAEEFVGKITTWLAVLREESDG